MRIRFLQLAAVFGVALLAPTPAAAFGPNLIGNPGFERPVVAGDVVQPPDTLRVPALRATSIAGWSSATRST